MNLSSTPGGPSGRLEVTSTASTARVRNRAGGRCKMFDRLHLRALVLFRVGEMKIFPGYSFPNEKDRHSTTFDPR
jgi:hypothetical protein